MPIDCYKEIGILSMKERPITVDEACGLRLLLFGNTVSTFGTEWFEQNFYLQDTTPYGFYQKRAGPCGVLAAVQAYVISDLLFNFNHVSLESGLLRPPEGARRQALARAFATILWQAGENVASVVAVKDNKLAFDLNATTTVLQADGLIEYVHLLYFDCKGCLLEYFLNFAPKMMEEHSLNSCILFLYSLLLSHGIDKIRKEMDFPESHLIGDDGYCSQEIVNLILVGKAVANLHDGDIELNSGQGGRSTLRGIPVRSRIGLLSLHEFYNLCRVGENYKTPMSPVWVLLRESHFSVVFGTSKDILQEYNSKFFLYHFDALLKDGAETVFLIEPKKSINQGEKIDAQDLSVIEKCILTKWPNVKITKIENNSEEKK